MTVIKLSMPDSKTLSYDNSRPLGTPGGEGAVYEVVSPVRYRDYCVKIYADNILADSTAAAYREEKIKYLAQFTVESKDPRVVICWPVSPVYKKRKFCGFLMRKAFSESIQLEWLKIYALKKTLAASTFKVFDGSSAWTAVYNRLVLANNIAYAIHLIHAAGKYVLVDTKPQNILVNAAGDVSLVDLDSVQVADGATLRFSGPVATEQYIPPEGYDGRVKWPGDAVISKSWDCFSYAIVAYQLIIGTHPYTGSYRSPYNKGHDLMYNIKSGLFLHGNKSSYLLNAGSATLKSIYSRWEGMPPELRNTFMRAFEAGQYNPDVRPDMAHWGKVLTQAIADLQPHLPAGGPSAGVASTGSANQTGAAIAGVNTAVKTGAGGSGRIRRILGKLMLWAVVLGGFATWGWRSCSPAKEEAPPAPIDAPVAEPVQRPISRSAGSDSPTQWRHVTRTLPLK